MPALCRPSIALILFVLLVGVSTSLRAQDAATAPIPAAAPAGPSTLPDEQTIATRLGQLKALEAPTEEDRQEIDYLQKATEAFGRLRQEQEEYRKLREAAESAPTTLAEINGELNQTVKDETLDELQVLSSADIANRVEATQSQLQQAKTEQDNWEKEVGRRALRRTLIPEEIVRTQQQIDEVNAQIAAAAPAELSQRLADARRTLALIRKAELEATLQRLQYEPTSYDLRRELIEKRTDRAKRLVRRRENLLATLKQAQLVAIEREAATARDELEQAIASSRVVTEAIRENTAYADRRLTLAGDVTASVKDLAEREADYQLWSNDFTMIKAQIERVGLTEAIGYRLQSSRSALPDVDELTTRLDEINGSMAALLDRTADDQRYRRLQDDDDLEAEVDRRMANAELADETPENVERVRAELRDRLVEQRGILVVLIGLSDTLEKSLVEEQTKIVELRTLITEYREFINERILWVRSMAAIDGREINRVLDNVVWLTRPEPWAGLRPVLWTPGRGPTTELLLAIVAWLGLLIYRPFLNRHLQNLGRLARARGQVRFSTTVRSLVITAAQASVWPLLLFMLAWTLRQAPATETTIRALASGLVRAAFLMWMLLLLMHTCRPGGLADLHFDWETTTMHLLRRHLRWFIPVMSPLACIVTMSVSLGQAEQPEIINLGRAAFIAGMLAESVLLWRLLHPRHGMLAPRIASTRDGWLSRLSFIWFPAVIASPLVMAAIAGFGYLFTAVEMQRRVSGTLALAIVLALAHGLALRWLHVQQRNLAIDQARKRLAARREAADKEGGDPAAITLPPEDEIDVAAVSIQTRKLLRTLIMFAVLIGVALLWSDILPAVGFLNQFELGWSYTVPGDTPDAAPEVVKIMLLDLLNALVILAVTIAVARNIPGVLEITLLKRLPLSPGGRYATTTLVRYVLTIVGLVLSFNAIGIGWSKVQWLAAAVTVGLGFGLQEIFANFVSGIIILFERPVRVGDTVTIGTTTGTITRIRIRATTIVDWDRKELIIPNREFVTGQVINWTLSDSTLRVRVPVGIAYGSDTVLAQQILLRIGRDNPRILTEPPPQAMFLGFGESSLDFELRGFIGQIEDFVAVRDELHFAIDRAFREAGIEIAFPQRDLHIRSIHGILPVETRAEPARDEDRIAT